MMGVLSNARHERFAQGIAAGKPASQAYIEAGYRASGNSAEAAASRLLSGVKVTARVAELMGRVAEGVVLTRQWVIERLIENVNRAMQVEAVKDTTGKLTGEYRYDGGVANRALELLGKEQGMFKDQLVAEHNYIARLPTPVKDMDEWQKQYAPQPTVQ